MKKSSKEVTNCQCVNGPAPPFNSRTAKRKEKTSGVTSVLKRQKLDYGCDSGGVEGGVEGDDEHGDDDNDDNDDRQGNEAHHIVQNQANVPQRGFPFVRSHDLPPKY